MAKANELSSVTKSLKQLNKVLTSFKYEDLIEKLNSLEPKDFINYYIIINKLIIENKELLKTDKDVKKENEVNIIFTTFEKSA